MARLTGTYEVLLGERSVGYYYVFSDGTMRYSTGWGSPWDIEEQLSELGLDKETEGPVKVLDDLIDSNCRVPGRKKIIYADGELRMERQPEETDECFSIYRRSAEKGDPDWDPLAHDAPHHEGPNTPEGMREWASWYLFRKMDDGTFEAELDEAWWWGGGHNDGGTIRREIPEEWEQLPYEEFLERVVTIAAASHYGFTAKMLLEKEGLREFFGFSEEGDK